MAKQHYGCVGAVAMVMAGVGIVVTADAIGEVG